jgi:hypothetical protein
VKSRQSFNTDRWRFESDTIIMVADESDFPVSNMWPDHQSNPWPNRVMTLSCLYLMWCRDWTIGIWPDALFTSIP